MSRFLYAIVSLYFLTLVQARALNDRAVRSTDLVTPSLHITSPTKGSTHFAGEPLLVAWDARDISKNTKGQLFLGYTKKGNTDEHLYWLLAIIPDLAKGHFSFPVNASWDTWQPKLESRPDYVVAVIGEAGWGDSSDTSPPFTLKKKKT